MPVRRAGLPELRIRRWRVTRDMLHFYAQVAGEIRAAMAPPEKHWYHVSLRATAGGLTTTPIPSSRSTFEITLDLSTCCWIIVTDAGARWHTRGWEGAILPYATLVNTRNPERRLLEFLRVFRGWGNF